jgi:cytosine/adenosine deaminase-related metal-dependent hydrolase
MEYRKFKADYLFNGHQLLNDGQVLIAGLNGEIAGIVSESDAGDEAEVLKGILSPGFINAHCHLELSHLKSKIQENSGLVEFVASVVSGRHFPDDEILAAIEKAEAGMINEGIVAVGDICNNSLTLLQKEKKNLHYYNFIEVSGWNPDVSQPRFEKSKLYYDEFIKKNQPASLTPHAPYSLSDALWGKITPFFSGKVETIHNQETQDEDEFFLTGTGSLLKMYQLMKIDNSFYRPKKLKSIQTYFKKFSAASSVILVHNTFTKQEDLDYVNQHKPGDQMVSFCLCPNANLYIENKLPPVELLVRNKCNIILGTDSLASNHQLSILEELKTISKAFPGVNTETLLQWATINGAKALKMESSLGNFEKGKTPGIVLIDNTAGKEITSSSTARKIL